MGINKASIEEDGVWIPTLFTHSNAKYLHQIILKKILNVLSINGIV